MPDAPDPEYTSSRRCLSCGYDLRGSDSLRCPECGREHSEEEWRLRDRYSLEAQDARLLIGAVTIVPVVFTIALVGMARLSRMFDVLPNEAIQNAIMILFIPCAVAAAVRAGRRSMRLEAAGARPPFQFRNDRAAPWLRLLFYIITYTIAQVVVAFALPTVILSLSDLW